MSILDKYFNNQNCVKGSSEGLESMKKLRNSSKHSTLLSEIKEFIQSASYEKNDLQDFLEECISPKVGLFDLLRYRCYNLMIEHLQSRRM